MAKETLDSLLDGLINQQLKQIVISNPVQKDGVRKIRIRPVLLRGALTFQAEELTEKQAFHKNFSEEEIKAYIRKQLDGGFCQLEAVSALGSGTVLVGKKGTMTVKGKWTKGVKDPAGLSPQADSPADGQVPAWLEHNRKKKYLLEEGTPIPFLEDLGVLTAEGKVVRSRYDKFRQINRFLEFIEDILPGLDKTRETTILDFGCGKSYLTFVMYYYLHEKKGYPVRIIGLDLKQDVIRRCNLLAERYGFDTLRFYHGDIASYDGVDRVDMVVTLHACDVATDYALEKAVRWGAKVILSVPCCQHELNGQMHNELMKPVFGYGLIKERMAALYTDALRAEILEHMGYRTQILEFIDMEHTPKNILIRAVYDGKPKNNQREIEEILEFLHVEPTLYRLLMKAGEESGNGR